MDALRQRLLAFQDAFSDALEMEGSLPSRRQLMGTYAVAREALSSLVLHDGDLLTKFWKRVSVIAGGRAVAAQRELLGPGRTCPLAGMSLGSEVAFHRTDLAGWEAARHAQGEWRRLVAEEFEGAVRQVPTARELAEPVAEEFEGAVLPGLMEQRRRASLWLWRCAGSALQLAPPQSGYELAPLYCPGTDIGCPPRPLRRTGFTLCAASGGLPWPRASPAMPTWASAWSGAARWWRSVT